MKNEWNNTHIPEVLKPISSESWLKEENENLRQQKSTTIRSSHWATGSNGFIQGESKISTPFCRPCVYKNWQVPRLQAELLRNKHDWKLHKQMKSFSITTAILQVSITTATVSVVRSGLPFTDNHCYGGWWLKFTFFDSIVRDKEGWGALMRTPITTTTTLPWATTIQGVVGWSILFVVPMWHRERASRSKHGRGFVDSGKYS